MSDKKGNQYNKPDSTPSEEHTESLKENSKEDIIGGARQEDQLKNFKPDPETEGKIDSQPPPRIDNGENEGTKARIIPEHLKEL